jgi:nitrite reductase/ring-hydroxylating ferredoxin subunit
MSNQACPRRRFLQVVAHGGAVASAAALGVGCGVQLGGSYAAGNVSQLAVPSIQAIPNGPVAIGRDAGGVYAMTLICTHQQCDMSSGFGIITSTSVTCRCHGSSFDANGNVVNGPARSPLEHFEVTIDAAGEITVNADATVPESTRTPVA